jgi:hypothetical protein
VLARSDLKTLDGELLDATLDLPFTLDDGNLPKVQRLQKAFMETARLGRQISVRCDVACWPTAPMNWSEAPACSTACCSPRPTAPTLHRLGFCRQLLVDRSFADRIRPDDRDRLIAADDEQDFELADLDLS